MLGKKCIVKRCTNHSGQGSGKIIRIYADNEKFEAQEFVCMPCWKTVKGEKLNKHAALRIIESCLK